MPLSKGKRDIKYRLEQKKIVVGECWRFDGKILPNGYGEIWYEGKGRLLHRVSAHVFLDFDLDSELKILHAPECNFKDCWNPMHLRPGTQIENLSDARSKGNRTWVVKDRRRRGETGLGAWLRRGR